LISDFPAIGDGHAKVWKEQGREELSFHWA
jgi:hypothetical protein